MADLSLKILVIEISDLMENALGRELVNVQSNGVQDIYDNIEVYQSYLYAKFSRCITYRGR